MELVKPSEEYKDSFIAAAKEVQGTESASGHESERYRSIDIDVLEKDFAGFIRGELEKAEGKNLPDEYVPETNYWLIDGDEYIGRISVRHRLNDNLLAIGGHIGYDIRPSRRRQGYGKAILELVLPKAKELGISRALVTCDESNTGSRKIIEANGGVLENSVPQGEGKPNKLRFWIRV